MKNWKKLLVVATILFSASQVSAKELTLCWAAWDPANALVELSKDFTKETGIKMRFEFVPWTNFASRFQNELNSKGKLCDLMIGDSQWIGGAATNHQYIKLNKFFKKEGISMDDYVPATVEGYSTWPKGTKNYWALPAMADALGWVYRKDWFARPELQKEFKAKYGRKLAPPKTWIELRQIAKFFQGRMIDGKKVYGAAIYTERGSEGITMGATSALYPFGLQWQDPKKPYHLEGFVNSKDAVRGLKFYKSLYDCCTPPGHSDAYMVANLDAYKSGQVAMQMNWFAFFPGIVKDPKIGGNVSGFFVNPREKTEASVLGGQGISVVAFSDKKKQALQYIKWFSGSDVQKKWWKLGGASASKAVLNDPKYIDAAPFDGAFIQALAHVKDFWQEPTYAELLQASQKRFSDYVVAGKGTAKQALDKLVVDWRQVFEDDGKIK
jgi:multiple sugar transport system substrate-binding protein